MKINLEYAKTETPAKLANKKKNDLKVNMIFAVE